MHENNSWHAGYPPFLQTWTEKTGFNRNCQSCRFVFLHSRTNVLLLLPLFRESSLLRMTQLQWGVCCHVSNGDSQVWERVTLAPHDAVCSSPVECRPSQWSPSSKLALVVWCSSFSDYNKASFVQWPWLTATRWPWPNRNVATKQPRKRIPDILSLPWRIEVTGSLVQGVLYEWSGDGTVCLRWQNWAVRLLRPRCASGGAQEPQFHMGADQNDETGSACSVWGWLGLRWPRNGNYLSSQLIPQQQWRTGCSQSRCLSWCSQ